MKKALKLFLVIGIMILLISFTMKNYFEKKEETKKLLRYNEIRENIKKAMDWQIRATFVIKSEENCNNLSSIDGAHISSSGLIGEGYLKKDEMLDVDKVSYCKATIITHEEENCNIGYKIYISCKDYQDEGYINWDK